MYYTEADIRRSQIRWWFQQMSPEDVNYCKQEALRLYDMGLTDDYGRTITYDSWLHCIAENTYLMNEAREARRCAELGDC